MKNGVKFGLIIIVVFAIFLGAVLIGGNKEEKNGTSPAEEKEKPVVNEEEEKPEETLPTKIAALKTCVELNGYVCEVGNECEGKWLDASDTFSCCSKKCGVGEGEILSIEPFDLESDESEELGSITE